MAANSLYQLSDMAEQVAENYGDTSDITITKAKKWINRAGIIFSEVGDWRFLNVYGEILSTVVSQELYEVTPSGTNKVNKILTLYSSQPIQRRIQLIEDRQFRRLYPNNTATGFPYYYREAGRSTTVLDVPIIGLYPIPDSIITLRYDFKRQIPMLINDTDDPRLAWGMPQHYCELVIDLATAIGFRELDDSMHGEAYQEAMSRIAGAYKDDGANVENRFVFAPMESEDMDRFFDPMLDPRFYE